MKPRSMKIIGAERSLEETAEGVITLKDVIEENRYRYRKAWRSWLPDDNKEDKLGRMSYTPVVAMRRCYAEIRDENGNLHYLIFVLNQARDERPKSPRRGKEQKFHCKLCKNILGKGMIISEIDDYFVTPNGFPYHDYASLLIHKSDKRSQLQEPRPEEIATWMKTSTLLGQYLFFNPRGAGASIFEHQHVQMVDPNEMQMDNKVVLYPLLLAAEKKQRVNKAADVFRIEDYVDALMFIGSDAPNKVVHAVHALIREDHAYNILVDKERVFVIGRNKAREVSYCMKRKVGGYEITGIALMGDIEERSGGKKIKIEGAKIFSNMSYEVALKNIRGATVPLDSVAKVF